MKNYVPIYHDFLEITKDLSTKEIGGLVDALVSYSAGEEYEHLLTDGSLPIFLLMKERADRHAALSEVRSRAGSSRKKPAKEPGSKAFGVPSP